MDLAAITDGADRFVAYVEELTSVIGHADRALPLRDYCAGLLTAEGRKSVEPMAAVTAPARVSVQHQKLLHFVGEGNWSDDNVLAKVRELVIPAIELTDRSKPGLSTIPPTPSRAPIRSACTISIAGSSASRPIVRWR
jgi:SRSO17 transposase